MIPPDQPKLPALLVAPDSGDNGRASKRSQERRATVAATLIGFAVLLTSQADAQEADSVKSNAMAQAFRSFMTNPPVISHFVFKHEELAPSMRRDGGDAEYEGGWQSTNAFWLRRVSSTIEDGKLTGRLREIITGQWGTTEWALPQDSLQISQTDPGFHSLSKNTVQEGVDHYQWFLAPKIFFDFIPFLPGTFQWGSGGEFSATSRLGVPLTGRFDFAASGRPDHAVLFLKGREYFRHFLFTTNTGLPFYPSEILSGFYNVETNHQRILYPLSRLWISAIETSAVPLGAEAFLPDRWTNRRLEYIHFYSNNVRYATWRGKTRLSPEIRLVKAPAEIPQRNYWVRGTIWTLMGVTIILALWWAKNKARTTPKQPKQNI